MKFPGLQLIIVFIINYLVIVFMILSVKQKKSIKMPISVVEPRVKL